VGCYCPSQMAKNSKSEIFYTGAQAMDWLNVQMSNLGFSSLERLSEISGIDKGTLSRYFRHERRPSIDSIGPLCKALQISPEKLLKILGAIPK